MSEILPVPLGLVYSHVDVQKAVPFLCHVVDHLSKIFFGHAAWAKLVSNHLQFRTSTFEVEDVVGL